MTVTYLQRRYKSQESNHTFIEKNPFSMKGDIKNELQNNKG